MFYHCKKTASLSTNPLHSVSLYCYKWELQLGVLRNVILSAPAESVMKYTLSSWSHKIPPSKITKSGCWFSLIIESMKEFCQQANKAWQTWRCGWLVLLCLLVCCWFFAYAEETGCASKAGSIMEECEATSWRCCSSQKSASQAHLGQDEGPTSNPCHTFLDI